MRRRRLTPYLLLAVLVLGSSMGIGLGLSEAPAGPPSANQSSGCSLGRTFATAGLKFRYPKLLVRCCLLGELLIYQFDRRPQQPGDAQPLSACRQPNHLRASDRRTHARSSVGALGREQLPRVDSEQCAREADDCGRAPAHAKQSPNRVVVEASGQTRRFPSPSTPANAHNWTEMTAYLRSPGVAQAASEVSHMLATVTFTRS